jgi:hypothetical protein
MPWSRGCDRRRALGVFWAQKSNFIHAETAPDGLVAAIERSDAVVNLAGEPLMGGRWTAARRAVLEGSRIAVTEQLVRAMAEAKSRPRGFISGSGVGYYRDRADELLTEASSPADDFLARLCLQWEYRENLGHHPSLALPSDGKPRELTSRRRMVSSVAHRAKEDQATKLRASTLVDGFVRPMCPHQTVSPVGARRDDRISRRRASAGMRAVSEIGSGCAFAQRHLR